MKYKETAMIDRENAAHAYRVYGSVTDFKNFRGEPMPQWDDLPETIRLAWVKACESVRVRTEDRK